MKAIACEMPLGGKTEKPGRVKGGKEYGKLKK
jgi:hypothetical protein